MENQIRMFLIILALSAITMAAMVLAKYVQMQNAAPPDTGSLGVRAAPGTALVCEPVEAGETGLLAAQLATNRLHGPADVVMRGEFKAPIESAAGMTKSAEAAQQVWRQGYPDGQHRNPLSISRRTG